MLSPCLRAGLRIRIRIAGHLDIVTVPLDAYVSELHCLGQRSCSAAADGIWVGLAAADDVGQRAM